MQCCLSQTHTRCGIGGKGRRTKSRRGDLSRRVLRFNARRSLAAAFRVWQTDPANHGGISPRPAPAVSPAIWRRSGGARFVCGLPCPDQRVLSILERARRSHSAAAAFCDLFLRCRPEFGPETRRSDGSARTAEDHDGCVASRIPPAIARYHFQRSGARRPGLQLGFDRRGSDREPAGLIP